MVKMCSIEGCEKSVKALDMCGMHYQRLKKHGDPLYERPLRVGVERCSIDGCNRLLRARGMCPTHYRRWSIHGDPNVVLPPHRTSGPDHYAWLPDDELSYNQVHQRLHRGERGPAKNYSCTHCGATAQDWAYTNDCPDEKISDAPDSLGYRYSSDPNRYIPLCRTCHKRFDSEFINSQKEVLL